MPVDWDDAAPQLEGTASAQALQIKTPAALRPLDALDQAVALLDEWISAYRELERENLRLRAKYDNAMVRYEHASALAEFQEIAHT